MAYVAGITCQIAAIYFLQVRLSDDQFTMPYGARVGLLLGLSVVICFPYVLSLAGIFC
jgi:hypothetical protein